MPINPDAVIIQPTWKACNWKCSGMPAHLVKRWERVEDFFIEAAARFGVSAPMLAAMAWTESRFNTRAGSHAGAQGLMQFMPATGRWVGGKLRELGIIKGEFDPWEPYHAVNGAAYHMARLIKRFGGDRRKAIGAYNAGAGRIAKGIWPEETLNYVNAVFAREKAMQAILRNCRRISEYEQTNRVFLTCEQARALVPGFEAISKSGKTVGPAPAPTSPVAPPSPWRPGPAPSPSPSPGPWGPPTPAPAQAGGGAGLLLVGAALLLLAGEGDLF